MEWSADSDPSTTHPMIRLPRLLVLALAALLVLSRPARSTEVSDGTIRGAITDSSDGALPGVSVTATSLDGGVLATAVTDGTGAYELQGLSAGQVRLSFHLDGFAAADALVTIEARQGKRHPQPAGIGGRHRNRCRRRQSCGLAAGFSHAASAGRDPGARSRSRLGLRTGKAGHDAGILRHDPLPSR